MNKEYTIELMQELVPFEEAVEMKNLGYDKPCFAFYFMSDRMLIIDKSNKGSVNVAQAPTYQQAFRWFREEYNLKGGIEYIGGSTPSTTWWDIYVIGYLNTNTSEMTMRYQPYEEAQLACLRKLIQIVKKAEL